MQVNNTFLIDLQYKNYNLNVTAYEGDTKSRYIDLQILNNGQIVNLTGHSIKVYAVKPDQTKIYNNCTITDATNGKAELELTSQILAIAGTVQAQFIIYGTDSSILSTQTFSINVEKSLRDDGAIESTDEFTALTQGINKLEGWDAQFQTKYDGLNAQYASQLTSNTNKLGILSANGITESSVAEAVKNDRVTLTSHTTQLVDITTNKLVLKADKTYVDTQFANIGNASPKGTYTDLTSLQTAYPTGAVGVYIVISDGKWYYWNGSAWTAGGTYQSSGIPNGFIMQKHLGKPYAEGIVGKNLFDLNNYIIGQYVSGNTGALVANAIYGTSDHIPIGSSTIYTVNNGSTWQEMYAFYDVNKTFISGNNGSSAPSLTFTTPSNAVYIRISFKLTQLSSVQLELGSVKTTYEPYTIYLDPLKIKSQSISNSAIAPSTISTDKLNFKPITGDVNKNLFNRNNVTSGYYVNYNDGKLNPNANENASEYIPIIPSTNYTISNNSTWQEMFAFYDINKVYISGNAGGSGSSKTFTTPSNAAYIRISCLTAQLPYTQLELGNTKTAYEDYTIKMDGKFIKTSTIPKEALNFTVAFNRTINYITVKKDGTGNFTTITDAINSITTNDSSVWYEIQLYDAVYDEKSINLPAYVILRSKFILGRSWIKGYLPKDSTDATITPTSTLNIAFDCELHDLRITCQNMRYAVHSENNGNNKNAQHKIYNCEFIHYGNAEVLQYRTDNNLLTTANYNQIWNGTNPWGYGSASGVVATFEQCIFTGVRNGWYVHNREYFTNPTINILKNCTITGQQYSILIENLGSGTEDQVILEGCQLNGLIQTTDTPWISTDINYQYANHADIRILGHGNNSVPYASSMRGACLKITSSSSTDSKVTISGTASDVLFGNTVSFNGKSGLNGYVYGSLDISGILVGLGANTTVNNNLGRRLGDCTTTNKTLVVAVDNNSPITITFNQNYTSMTNADILGFINTQLGSSATATEFNISKEYIPEFTDESKALLNSSANGIKKGSPVCYNSDYTNIRLMLDTDDASLFAGITMEDINPNTYGKVQIRGYVYIDRLIKENGTSFTFASKYGVSSNGKIVQNNTNSIGKCMHANYLYINAQ